MSNSTNPTSIHVRSELIKTLLREHLGREVSHISTLGRDSNNLVHLVHLTPKSSADDDLHAVPTRPGTKSLPSSTQQVVARLFNPDAMLHNKGRVQNEVAAISLMRDALSSFRTKVVPDVYAWNSADRGDGWIVQEYMPGGQLTTSFSDLSSEKKRRVLDQVARVFGLIQSYTVPKGVNFGGLTFDDEGQVCSGELSIWGGGPFETYADICVYIFRTQMERIRSIALVDGWSGTGLSERLSQFDESGGFASLLRDTTATARPTLVHGDLSLENLLFDPETLQLTALLDYDFTHIASLNDEFFYSFMDFHGIVSGPFETGELQQLRLARLSRFKPGSYEQPADVADVDWATARMWQEAMDEARVKSPADLANVGELASIYWFLLDVCPPYFLLPRWLGRRTKEQQFEAKREVAENLDKYLSRWRF